MKDDKFDKLIKNKINETTKVPDNINSLFSDFERRIIMEKKKRKINVFKYITALASAITILGGGGCVFAHVNGIETIISPLLRNLGINSKYEEEKIDIDKNVVCENTTIKLLDVGIDDTSLIVGYEINIENNNIDNWLDIYGDYLVNGLSVSPISQSIDKTEDGKYIMYQLFDTAEINFKNEKTVDIGIEIHNIETYTEFEDIDSVGIAYNNSIEGEWSFCEKNIKLTNEQKTKEYTFDTKPLQILDNVKISVDSLISGAYTNILKLETNKENYNGDSFDVYYKILDENDQEIVTASIEEKIFDDRIYNDRIAIGDISLNQTITVEVYLKTDSEYKNVGNIKLNLNNKKETKAEEKNITKYTGKEYSFDYNSNWKELGVATKDRVGAYNRRVGAFQIEIPSTSNSEYPCEISILTHKNTNLNKFSKELKDEYLTSEEEGGMNLKEESLYNDNGKMIIFELSYNELLVTYLLEENGNVYEIEFSGNEIEFNNLQDDVEELVDSFQVN